MHTSTGPSAHPDSPYLVAQPVRRPEERHAAIVLLATDGGERSDGALRLAAARASATGAVLEVITVIQSDAVLTAEAAYVSQDLTLLRLSERRRIVEEQIARVLGKEHVCSISVFEGNPAYTISRVAIERRASMIVVGLGRHLIAHRLFSDETALQLARIARVPVLAVPEKTRGLPRHAVVAIDFSDISIRAAQSAIESLGDEGRVDLAHVMPHAHEDAFALEEQAPYERWAEQQLATLAATLVVPQGVALQRVTLHGRPASELLDYAIRVGADLISTGTHGGGFVTRSLLGSVTTKLLRGATCTLLTVPRDPLPALAPTEHDAAAGATWDAPLAWGRLLSDFTKHNRGRRTILEVDDRDIGAQGQEYNYPLLGVSFSERDGRVDLMLGDDYAGGRHLSRTMGSVVAVDVLTDGAGHDTALRVQHGLSQTLLTFAKQ